MQIAPHRQAGRDIKFPFNQAHRRRVVTLVTISISIYTMKN